MAHDDQPFLLRLAYAQAAWRSAVRPCLEPDMLILGTPPPRTVIAYATCAARRDFVLDDTLAADHPAGQEVAAYWQAWLTERPQPILPLTTALPNLADCLLIHGQNCHATSLYALAITGGLQELRQQIAFARLQHPGADQWYTALEITLDGIAGYLHAHADAARHAADTTDDVCQAEEWRRLAANCRHLSTAAPETFLQAAQLLYFLFILTGHDAPGHVDQYLWPFLERDLLTGALNPVTAQEIVDCLFLRLAEHASDGIILGGIVSAEDGTPNPLTRMCLHAIRRLHLLAPQADASPTRHRRSRGQAYTCCGCGRLVPADSAHGTCALVLNAVKPLLLALHDGRDEQNGLPVGPSTGRAETLLTFAALEDAVWTQCRHLLYIGLEATAGWQRWGMQHAPDFLRSLLTPSSVARGRDWHTGGADYHESLVEVVGIMSLAESLAVIRQLVFTEQRLSLPELVDLLEDNWTDADALRHACLHAGSGEEADALAACWLHRLHDWLSEQCTLFGGTWSLVLSSDTHADRMGQNTGATPNGRHIGEPLTDATCVPLPSKRPQNALPFCLSLPADTAHTPEYESWLTVVMHHYLTREA